ncbi:TetR/AcrR family transcriptional regulator [Virgisporangium aurantiacum]|uniref:TetR family transcriptional regulator n=1 Tax=Virgisporangium aurantiacum TaxID=175570 RepID=A0A8J3Z4A0_9ACTN|nr:TetR/AcrR family transcriptional regulator [Virgisporangium aurantiacum]GIJ55020.1 TetR family transcriptional regulator [Virgisporangium aurantiacum]
MGNREDLLAGAKQCLFDKGFARTTARDVTAASGVSLAAIGYHFGTKEALLTAALQDAIAEWGAGLAETLSGATDLASAWTLVLESFASSGPLWAVQLELVAQLGRDPALRAQFAGSNKQAREGLVGLFRSLHPDLDPADADRLGALYQALLVGSAATWLADPDSAPAAEDLLAAMRLVTDRQGPR